jgi:hypothetical protein
MRSTVVLLAIAGVGYAVAALVHDSLPFPNDPVAFARPAHATESNSNFAPPVAATMATMSDTAGPRRFDPEWTETPRECDLGKGISTACLFMD